MYPARQISLFGCICVLALLGSAEGNERLARRRAWTSSKIQGAPTTPPKYKVQKAFPKVRFTKPTSVQELPGEGRLLVTEMEGKVYTLKKAKNIASADVAGDLLDTLGDDASVSLFSATFHPDFAKNRTIYVCYVSPAKEPHTRVSSFQLSKANPPTLDRASESVIITWPSGGHNAGCLRFGKDGMLYVSTGDGFGPNPPDNKNTGQDISDLLGSVLRIDVTPGESGYKTPKDNPFVNMRGARGEIWAYGLRNPWKFGIDPKSGDIFVADNGWETWEMVHKIQKGGNCGWPVMEGRAALRTEVKVGPTPIIPPVKDHHHSEANSVIGGPVYRGSKQAELNGTFIYGDYITGTIWGLQAKGENEFAHSTLVDTDLRIVDFSEGYDGEIYVLDYDFTGQIYELVPSGRVDNSASFPRRLSETGIFKDVKTLVPQDGVIPYQVKAPRWLDGASARRWVGLPGTKAIQLVAGDNTAAQYPEGTVFVQHLDLKDAEGNVTRLETKVLHFEDAEWRPYSFVWNDAGTDATLVDSVGANRTIQWSRASGAKAEERTWHVGAVNECKLCHNAGSGYVLGFSLEQLALNTERGDSQVGAFKASGVITSRNVRGAFELVNPHDASQSLDDRARSYLHANCSSCHHRRGNAIVSFYLRRDLSYEELNTSKGTGIGTFGMRNAKLIVPGDPYRSVLFYRMSKLGYSRMPYIGSQAVDSQGIALIDAWIRSLSKSLDTNASGPVKRGSKDYQALETLDTSKDADTKLAAIKQLVSSSEGALSLIARMHAERLDANDFAVARDTGHDVARSDIRGLFETFVPEAKRRARLGPNPNPADILKLNASAERGRLIFFSDGARCRNCHDARDARKSVGPTILDINKKFKTAGELVDNVLKPSKKIDDKFAAYQIITDTGRLVTGLLVRQSAQQVTLRTAEGKNVTVSRDRIDEMRKSTKSLMPDGVLADLTAQEAADLLAYLRSIKE